MKGKKFLKVMFGQTSGDNKSFKYKIGEINVADNWNPNATNPKEMGGFNFSVEDKILRWLIRGDTIYDVKIPEDAEIIDIPHPSTPHGVFRANKIIISNPRKVTDEMAMEFYKKSTIPEQSYYKAMIGCAIRGCMNTALQILKDKVNHKNINLAIEEFKDFSTNSETGIFDENELGTNSKRIYEELLKIQNQKYIILDFGKVLAYPITGDWFITPLFLNLIDMTKIDKEELLKVMGNYSYIISRKAITLEEEYDIFYDFYKNVLNDINYPVTEEIIHNLAHDITYNDNKYGFYDNIDEELEQLSKEYTLILLSDNWPCAFHIMKNRGIDKYFKKMYISSVYGVQKKEGVFFDYPINDFNIKTGEAIFVDDNEELLDVAVTKGLDVRLMDRNGENNQSKYRIINNLEQI